MGQGPQKGNWFVILLAIQLRKGVEKEERKFKMIAHSGSKEKRVR